jgi:hypothetical protein
MQPKNCEASFGLLKVVPSWQLPPHTSRRKYKPLFLESIASMHPSLYPVLGLLYPFKEPQTLARILGAVRISCV